MDSNTQNSQTLTKIESLLTPMGIRREHVDIAGDYATAGLLAQIIYWHKLSEDGCLRMSVCKDGTYWIAKTKEAWMVETRLTENEIRRALPRLQSLGLIECRVWKFANIRQLHVRLVHERYFELISQISQHVESTTSKVLNPHSTPCGIHSFQHVESTVSYTKTTAEITEESNPGSAEASPVLAGMEKDKMNLEEKIEEQKHKKDTTAVEVGAQNLPAWWKSLVADMTGTPRKNLVGRDCGQLKLMARGLGDRVLTAQVIKYAVWNWSVFVNEARDKKGKGGKPPYEPDTGYLLSNVFVARDLYLRSIAPVVKLPEQMTKEFEPEPSVSYSEVVEVEEPKMSKEEALAKSMAKYEAFKLAHGIKE